MERVVGGISVEPETSSDATKDSFLKKPNKDSNSTVKEEDRLSKNIFIYTGNLNTDESYTNKVNRDITDEIKKGK